MNEKPFVPYKYKNPGSKSGQTRLEHYYPAMTQVAGLDPTQQRAMDSAMRGESIFLTGPGGCGKSYTVGKIVTRLREMGKRVRVTSTTGVSAILLGLGATTVHMLFAMGDVGDKPAETYVNKLKAPFYKKVHDMLVALDVLIIDEISMLLNGMFYKIDLILRSLRPNGRPFGGVQLICSGDFAQLPPIYQNIPGNESKKRKTPSYEEIVANADRRPLFQTDTWTRAGIQPILLDVDHRQSKDPAYAALTKRARLNQMTTADVNLLKTRELTRTCHPNAGDDVAYLFSTNAAVDDMNASKMRELDPATEVTFEAIYDIRATIPVAPFNSTLPQDERPPKQSEIEVLAHAFMNKNRADPEFRLRTGARVMLLSNLDVERGLGNGTLGHVVGFRDSGRDDFPRIPLVQFSGVQGITAVQPQTWKFEDNGTWEGSYTQIPLTLAWAVTIHKSQGATLSNVIAELRASSVRSRGAGYVAISRVPSFANIWFTCFEQASIFADPEVVRWLLSMA